MYKFNRNKIDDNTIKYEFENSDKGKLTFSQFLTLLKSENQIFLKVFCQALNNATEELSAYFWECAPVSSKSFNKKFEFVVIKSEALDKTTQDYSSFAEHLAKLDAYGDSFVSFANKNRDAVLVIPALMTRKWESGGKTEMFDYKNISQFTKNAPLKEQQKFWQAVASKLSQELEKSKAPKWLSTHGTGVPYLHVRIDSVPKYYHFEEYKAEKNHQNSSQNSSDKPRKKYQKHEDQGNLPPIEKFEPKSNLFIYKWKEKILRNLDKITFDYAGHIANAEVMKNPEKKRKREVGGAYQIKIDDEEINLLEFEKPEGEKDYLEIRAAFVNNIKQNIADWEIKKDHHDKDILQNKKTGVKVWKMIFLDLYENGEKDWAEIETNLKNSVTEQEPKENAASTEYQNDKFLLIGSIGGVILLGIIIFIFWPKNKKH